MIMLLWTCVKYNHTLYANYMQYHHYNYTKHYQRTLLVMVHFVLKLFSLCVLTDILCLSTILDKWADSIRSQPSERLLNHQRCPIQGQDRLHQVPHTKPAVTVCTAAKTIIGQRVSASKMKKRLHDAEPSLHLFHLTEFCIYTQHPAGGSVDIPNGLVSFVTCVSLLTYSRISIKRVSSYG